jgi:hypothetical protein
MKRKLLITLIALALTLVLGGNGQAITYDLVDQNVQVEVTSGNTNVYGPQGAYGWWINGVYNLYSQQWWIGQPGKGQVPVASPPLALTGSAQLAPNVATFAYAGAGFTIDEIYFLLGGPVGTVTSDLGETFRLINTSNKSETFYIYLYSDFDLKGIPPGDVATISKALDQAVQVGKGLINDTVVAPNASRGEVNFYAATLTRLSGAANYHLNNVLGPLGPGDMTYAFEWDVTLTPGFSSIISVDKHVNAIPVPPSLLLLGSGLVGLLGMRRFRKG